jgi:hypothetical protein
VDAQGRPVVDPTKNVLDALDSAVHRLDDLRVQAEGHAHKFANLRAEYDEKLRRAESARIDAIRAVDVGAVNQAAEVARVAATSLAAAVQASAEALRTQVTAAATAATVALAAEIDPLKKDIADLRRTQYEQAGQKAQVTEGKTDQRQGSSQLTAVIGVGVAIVSVLILAIGIYLANK